MCIRDRLYTEGNYRQEMALEFVNVAKEIGISVNLEVRTWDTILDDIHKEAVSVSYTHLDVYKRQS